MQFTWTEFLNFPISRRNKFLRLITTFNPETGLFDKKPQT